MNSPKPTEPKFEKHIEKALVGLGYQSDQSQNYDNLLCLVRHDLITFLKSSQQDEWEKLEANYGVDTENKVLSFISNEIRDRGIIDCLRKSMIDRGVKFNLCYFKPKSDNNPDLIELYTKNIFKVVRQVKYSEKNENSLDMVLFLNGLPIVTIELKNQLTGQNFKHSENQYKRDRDPKEPLFKFKRCIAHFCIDNNRASMTTKLDGLNTFFLPYNRGIENPAVEKDYRTSYMWNDVFTPDSLLAILEDFSHVSKEKSFYYDEKIESVKSKTKEVLIFPRYHQRDLINKFREYIRKDGVGTNYLVMHTTGSGKSYSIGWLAHMLVSLYKSKNDSTRMFDSIVVVTDRTVLDEQLQATIRSLSRTDGVVVGVERGSQQLREALEMGKDIVITTIQKFPFISRTIANLGKKNFAVIIDEVHSSQSGELSQELRRALTNNEDSDEDDLDEDTFDYEEMIRKEIENRRGKQENISFFGFTGTPKQKTLEVFGHKNSSGEFKPFHTYGMNQSISEGFTLDVLRNYTIYKRWFKVKETGDGKVEVSKKQGVSELIQYVDAHKITIERKVQIMLDHWFERGSKEIQGKARAMVITKSRKHCILYFRAINNRLKELGLPYRALVGFSGQITVDKQVYTESSCNKEVEHEGNVPLGLKKSQI